MKCKSCSIGCMLTVDEGKVTGNRCPRGLAYRSLEEKSFFFTKVRLKNSTMGHLSIKSDIMITEKEKEVCSKLLEEIELSPPIEANKLVIYNLGGTGISFFSQRKIVK